MMWPNRNRIAKRPGGSDARASREAVVSNKLGFHARPAAALVTEAKAFSSEIWLVKGRKRFSAVSILDVLRANLTWGETAVIEASGPDAGQAVTRLAEVICGLSDDVWKPAAHRRAEDDF